MALSSTLTCRCYFSWKSLAPRQSQHFFYLSVLAYPFAVGLMIYYELHKIYICIYVCIHNALHHGKRSSVDNATTFHIPVTKESFFVRHWDDFGKFAFLHTIYILIKICMTREIFFLIIIARRIGHRKSFVPLHPREN